MQFGVLICNKETFCSKHYSPLQFWISLESGTLASREQQRVAAGIARGVGGGTRNGVEDRGGDSYSEIPVFRLLLPQQEAGGAHLS